MSDACGANQWVCPLRMQRFGLTRGPWGPKEAR